MLGPYENLTLLSLSGSKPKRPNQIRALCLLLGPDFATDIIVLEVSVVFFLFRCANHCLSSSMFSPRLHCFPDIGPRASAAAAQLQLVIPCRQEQPRRGGSSVQRAW